MRALFSPTNDRYKREYEDHRFSAHNIPAKRHFCRKCGKTFSVANMLHHKKTCKEKGNFKLPGEEEEETLKLDPLKEEAFLGDGYTRGKSKML